LEKKFWYRKAMDGWSGLVSEPVGIKWKKDRDLTGELLDMVCKAWEAEKKASSIAAGKEKKEMTTEQKALSKKIESTGMGGLSFFAWFGFIGRRVSAEESVEASRLEKERREKRKGGKKTTPSPPESQDGEEEDDEDDLCMELEIFPDGDDLAIAFTEDLWPGAIKYFSKFLPLLDVQDVSANAISQQHKHKNKTPSQTSISNPTTTKKSQMP
jgi:hypothetical protein